MPQDLNKQYSAECKNCGQGINWLKGLGWTHLGASSCNNPVPKKGTIR